MLALLLLKGWIGRYSLREVILDHREKLDRKDPKEQQDRQVR